MPKKPQDDLRDKFFQVLLEATFPLQKHPDQEVALEALIAAARKLGDHLENELTEMRQEQAE